MPKLTAIHLCCGAGGITAGFEAEGIATAYAFDFNPICVQTHRINFPRAHCEILNIRDVHAADLPPADVVTCGIPCEPYSVAGYRKEESDSRDISGEVARLLGELARAEQPPRYVFLENVPPFRDSLGAAQIREALASYKQGEAKFHHADYGVPQMRKRWHLLAALLGLVPWPIPTHGSQPGLMTPGWLRFRDIREQQVAEPHYLSSKAWKGIIRRQSRAEERQRRGDFDSCYAKCYLVDDDDLVPTVLASWFKGASRNQVTIVFDDYRLRAPTELETRRAQGFPDSFVFAGNQRERYEQIGRAVPPPFAAAVARAIVETCT